MADTNDPGVCASFLVTREDYADSVAYTGQTLPTQRIV